MKVIQGKIEKILNKDLDQEDKFGNKTRLSVKVGEDWIGMGNKKVAGLSIQKGKEWIELFEGDEVVITAEENGKYLNAKTSDCKLVKRGEGKPQGKPTQTTQQFKATPGNFSDRDTEIKAGMFFNKAVDVAIAKHGEKVSKGTVVQAYQMLEEAYAECRSAKKAPEPRDVAPDEDVDFDSEIPF